MTINANEMRPDDDGTGIQIDDVSNSNYFHLVDDPVDCPNEEESENYGSRRLNLGKARKNRKKTFQGNKVGTDFRRLPGNDAEHGDMSGSLALFNAKCVWLKLTRLGNGFTCSYSYSRNKKGSPLFPNENEGHSFLALDSVTMEMPPYFYAGVFLSTNNQGPSEVTFKYPSYRLL